MADSPVMNSPQATADSVATDFVDRFAHAWADPSPERLADLAHPDVQLRQPMMRPMRGRAAWGEAVRELLGLVPDLRGEVVRWAASGPDLFIELRLRGTLARRPYEWTLVDRIRLEDGLVRERVSYFDPLPLMLEGLKRPLRLLGNLRLQLRRRRPAT
jgi:ketosteroid isomerase-like protein